MQSLAVKYRPKSFLDVSGQNNIKIILNNQLNSDTIKHGYLFCGGAGTGKTTCGRIFANDINKGIKGNIIELDGASNNSVDDIRKLIEQAQTKPMGGKYKVFIVDECHMLSQSAWNAFLKTLEEPPATAIFILCTTNPEKIPNTILSRVQRFNFQRIDTIEIEQRLAYILGEEKVKTCETETEAISLIARISDGGMRDAITLMDKCLSYNEVLSLDNVTKALGVANYEQMFKMNSLIYSRNSYEILKMLEDIHKSGLDLKQYIKDYFNFVLDLNIYRITKDLTLTKLPITDYVKEELSSYDNNVYLTIRDLLDFLLQLNNNLKYEKNPKYVVIAEFMLFVEGLK